MKIDVTKPLRQCVAIQLEGRVVEVDIRYEKLPLTCFLCGMMDHIEEHCNRFEGACANNCAKPYGRWFQDDVLGKDYRKPARKKYGPGQEGGWSMKAPGSEVGKDDETEEPTESRALELDRHGESGIAEMVQVLQRDCKYRRCFWKTFCTKCKPSF